MKHVRLVLKIAVTAGILAILWNRMDGGHVGEAVARFRPSSWGLAAILVAGQAFLRGWRWKILVNIGGRRLTLAQAVMISFTSQLANLVFVTSLGGMLAKASLTARAGAPLRKCLAAAACDRMMTLAAICLVAGATVVPFARAFPNDLAAGPASLFSAALILPLCLLPLLSRVLHRHARWPSQGLYARYARRYGAAFLARAGRFAGIVGLSVLAQSMFFASVLLLTKDAVDAVDGPDMLAVFSILPVIALVSSLPVSIGGWGLREGAFVYGYALLGIPAETAFFVSVQVGVMGMIVSALLGVPALLAMRLPKSGGASAP